jgi:hypothetical protein
MTPREYPADRWLAKGRWAYVWRAAGFFTVIMTAFWMIAVGLVHLGWDNPAWNWMLPHPYALTVATLLELLGKHALMGLLFGWIMSYQIRPRGGSKPAV